MFSLSFDGGRMLVVERPQGKAVGTLDVASEDREVWRSSSVAISHRDLDLVAGTVVPDATS
jgi:hypothetical protein